MMNKLPEDKQERRRYAEQLFKTYDKDKSGFLEVGEMIKVIDDIMVAMGSNHKANRKEVIKVMELMDTNKDYRISKKQFLKVLEIYLGK